jgi:hypothetical protein
MLSSRKFQRRSAPQRRYPATVSGEASATLLRPPHLPVSAFFRSRQRLVGPANEEVVLVDLGDDAEPPAARLAIALPVKP